MKYYLFILHLIFSLTTQAQESQFVHVNGVKIHYKIFGDGEPVLLLHNFTASHKMWLPWVKDFPGKYKYILPDLLREGRKTTVQLAGHR